MTCRLRPTWTVVKRLLRQTEIDVNRIQGLQLNHGIARGQILAEIDLANAQGPGEGRANCFSLNGCADCVHIGFGLFLLGCGLVVFQTGDDALFHKRLPSAVVDLRQITLGLESSKLRPLFASVEFDENVAFPYCLAGIKVNLRYRTWKVGADHHAVNRFHGADYACSRGPLLRFHHYARDRLRRRRIGSGLHRRLYLLKLKEAEGREQSRRHDQHQEHSLRHNSP